MISHSSLIANRVGVDATPGTSAKGMRVPSTLEPCSRQPYAVICSMIYIGSVRAYYEYIWIHIHIYSVKYVLLTSIDDSFRCGTSL